MEEIQGPTPAGTSRPYRSLAEALRAHRIPEENHAFIAAIVESVGATAFIDRGRYIEAPRRGGNPLHIGKTYTNGFTEDEVLVVDGRQLVLIPSEGRAPYQYVTHPSTVTVGTTKARTKRAAGSTSAPARPRPASTRVSQPVERDYGVCDECFMVRTASGGCACD